MKEIFNGRIDELVFIVEDGKELTYDGDDLWYLHEVYDPNGAPKIKIMIKPCE